MILLSFSFCLCFVCSIEFMLVLSFPPHALSHFKQIPMLSFLRCHRFGSVVPISENPFKTFYSSFFVWIMIPIVIVITFIALCSRLPAFFYTIWNVKCKWFNRNGNELKSVKCIIRGIKTNKMEICMNFEGHLHNFLIFSDNNFT